MGSRSSQSVRSANVSTGAGGHFRHALAGKATRLGSLTRDSGSGRGELIQVRAEGLLQKPPEIKGPLKDLLGGTHREQAVRVDQLKSHRDLFCRGGHHPRQEETREIVADHHTGSPSKLRQQPFPAPGDGST